MKLAIMQPYFFPYIGYFQLIEASDKIILYDQVNYIKKGWVNRNRIYDLNKGAVLITVPLKNASFHQLICDVDIDNSVNWEHRLLKMIYLNYAKTPFFDEFFPLLRGILEKKHEKLNTLNIETIIAVADFLKMKTPIVGGGHDYIFIEDELKKGRHTLETKTQRVLNICRHENASTYINPIGGRELYNKEIFKQNGIELYFLETQKYSYQQPKNEFIPHLSIIDVLFNCGIDGTRQLLKNYQLI